MLFEVFFKRAGIAELEDRPPLRPVGMAEAPLDERIEPVFLVELGTCLSSVCFGDVGDFVLAVQKKVGALPVLSRLERALDLVLGPRFVARVVAPTKPRLVRKGGTKPRPENADHDLRVCGIKNLALVGIVGLERLIFPEVRLNLRDLTKALGEPSNDVGRALPLDANVAWRANEDPEPRPLEQTVVVSRDRLELRRSDRQTGLVTRFIRHSPPQDNWSNLRRGATDSVFPIRPRGTEQLIVCPGRLPNSNTDLDFARDKRSLRAQDPCLNDVMPRKTPFQEGVRPIDGL